MLIQGSIPDKEPRIRVGIVLPEDGCREVRTRIPREPEVRLVGKEGAQSLGPGDMVTFAASGRGVGVTVNGGGMREGSIWRMEPEGGGAPAGRKTGICLQDAVAGRGFHWKKCIDVFLPGTVEVRRTGAFLLVVNGLPFEQYVMCVATSEMGAACPEALLASQTITARSWMLANVEGKHRDLGVDVCNDDCCQRYQGTTHLTEHAIRGAEATRGRVLMHGGAICDARYSKCCGGGTEGFEHAWVGNPVPYLRMKPDAPEGFRHDGYPPDLEARARRWVGDPPDAFCGPGFVPEEELKEYLGSVDEAGRYFRWERHIQQAELTALLKEKCSLDAEAVLDLRPLERGGSGRILRLAVDFLGRGGKESSHELVGEYRVRECLDRSFLYSSAFVVDAEGGPEGPPEAFVLKGAGWGHGVGYCQMGALGMALAGYGTEEILMHYFEGAEIRKIY